MSDIVERLRGYAKDQGRRHNIEDTCEEAADEIERLRVALSDEMLAEIIRTIPVKPEVAAAIFYRLRHEAATALRAYAEREKELVEALESYSCYCAAGYCEVGTHDDTICGFRARAVLSKHKEQK